MLQEQRLTHQCRAAEKQMDCGEATAGSSISTLRVAGPEPGRRRRPSGGSSVAVRGRQSKPAAGPRHALAQHPRVGGRPVGESQASVGPVCVVSRVGEDHRLRVPPRRVEGELRRGAAGFGGRGGQRIHFPSGGQERRRHGGGGVAFRAQGGSRGGGGGGGEGSGEEGSGPVVFKDLDGQRGDERQQPVGDVSQNQLLVGVPADTNTLMGYMVPKVMIAMAIADAVSTAL
ncbi:hypothetical protein EYF80_016176 [Liparis tanakae]|uniref:Uncharacterized protein n=1 Tax=Liparis tanakae TaxID=230148 RepID=A0A4Z2I739_9TELE|nr:hypothetical protein EYF80_016176 [Liparis tanakae]